MKRYILLAIILAILITSGIYLRKFFLEAKRNVEIIQKLKKNPIGDIKITPLDFQDGDIIFHESLSAQSESIKLATHSKNTHCGILYKIDGNYFVYEAIEPVKMTSLIEWMGRGRQGKFAVKRLIDSDQILTAKTIERLKEVGNRFKGKHYDPYFEWTDEKIYCSELVWKIYKEATGIEIGKRQKLRDFDLTSKTVKQKLKERYGNKIPFDENVISPESIFNSDKLISIQ